MATIKSFTDLSQSKKLAEILPLESADCFWDYDDLQKYHRISWFEEGYDKDSQLRTNENNVCAWSLAALLGVLPDHFYDKNRIKIFGMDKGDFLYNVFYESRISYIQERADNPVDACVAMIERLHKLEML